MEWHDDRGGRKQLSKEYPKPEQPNNGAYWDSWIMRDYGLDTENMLLNTLRNQRGFCPESCVGLKRDPDLSVDYTLICTKIKASKN
jgi:hypothetical protein